MRKRSILVNGIIVAIVGLVCVSLYKYVHPHRPSALKDRILDSIGLTIILFGQYIRISARGYKSIRHIDTSVLITDGPYALVRHPMYLASSLIGLGLVILLLKLWLVPVYLLLFFLWYWPQIHNEERWLVQKFGQEYIDYCKTTPCFFPRFRMLLGFKAKKYIPLKTAWVKKEWNTILVWSLVVVLVEGYEDISAYTLQVFIGELAFLLLIVVYFTAFAFLFREG
jgi:protein-S-isoprenylcysteine O-methyltransferase Ste14